MSGRSSPAPSGGKAPFRPIEKAPPISKREREASNNTRNMGLKVLYTTDDGNSTNCLARWPNLISVETAAIDERSLIGLVDLKICVQAVVQSSPELLPQVDRDYTVYAYDYSEPDTPQSGQGMLSWALAPGPPLKSITGRVCKNKLGLFSKGGDETVEVKLRLVPVRTTSQAEYSNNMDKSRQPGTVSDTSEWNALMTSQVGQTHSNQSFSAQVVSGNQSVVVSREGFSQIVDPSRVRAPTPLKSTQRGKARSTSRPSSRNSVKRPPGRPRKHPIGNASGSEDVGTDGDDAPPRKRVKPSGAEHDGTSAFGDPESLRIRASTAASIRGDTRARLVAGDSAGNGSQELPRAPTPLPNLPLQISTHDSAIRQSSLRRESVHSPSYISPYPDGRIDSGIGVERIHMSTETAISSPECHGTPVHTPQDISSSPPEVSRIRPTILPPSSPVLPQMPSGGDSGYVGSGGFAGEEEDDLCLIEADGDDNGLTSGQCDELAQSVPERRERAASPAASIVSQDEHNLLPHNNLEHSRPNSPNPQDNMHQGSFDGIVVTSNDPTPILEDASSITSGFPNHQAQREEPARAASFSAMPSAAASDTLVPLPTVACSQTERPRSREDEAADSEPTTLGRNLAKKSRILSKLEQSVLDGKTPDYCFNCGAIRTPTWRKAFTQDHVGDPGFIEYSDEPGRIMAVDVLTRDDTGRSTSYRLYKKSLLQTEFFKDYNPIMLCNPCGIWVSKYKRNRPRDMWLKAIIPDSDAAGKKKSRRRSKKKMTEDNVHPTSEAYGQSDAYLPSEVGFPQFELLAPRQLEGAGNEEEQPTPSENQTQCTFSSTDAMRPPSQDRSMLASQHSPVELKNNPKEVKRVLFASPRKEGSLKLLTDAQSNSVVSVPQTTAPKSNCTKESLTLDEASPFFEQENRTPTNNDSISALFGEDSPTRPTTPTRSNPPPNPFKTPTRPTPSHRPKTRSQSKSESSHKSGPMDPSPSRNKTPIRRSPRHHPDAVETPMSYINRMMSMPSASEDVGFGEIDYSLPDLPDIFLDDDDAATYLLPEHADDYRLPEHADDYRLSEHADDYRLSEHADAYRLPEHDEDPWAHIQYDMLGGHGDLHATEDELARMLEIALHAQAVRDSAGSPACIAPDGGEVARHEEIAGDGNVRGEGGKGWSGNANAGRDNDDETRIDGGDVGGSMAVSPGDGM